MITADYVRVMARYNGWQNRQLMDVAAGMSADDLTRERGAFFGTVQGTLNHLLWGDTLWMSRFCTDVSAPDVGMDRSTQFTDTIGEWNAARFALDGRIRMWSQTLRNTELAGYLTWNYSDTGQEVTRPMSFCVTHFFNHQTHHRGQIHAMLTAAGQKAPVSDLSYLPEDA